MVAQKFLRLAGLVIGVSLLNACASSGQNPTDAASAGDTATAVTDTALDAALVIPTSFTLFVTESPPGPDNGNKATWGGVQMYRLVAAGAAMVKEVGIDKSLVSDPAGLAYRVSSQELFVANRHGNNSADGVAGSISRFIWDGAKRALLPSGRITGNGLNGVHQLAFSPVSGELFAANLSGGVSRFTFDGSGTALAKGSIADGTTRGVVVTADGKDLFVTAAGNSIRHFDLASGKELSSTTPEGAGVLHYLRRRGPSELFVAAYGVGKVHRYAMATGGDLTLKESLSANAPIGMAFSADNLEIFIAGHRTSSVFERQIYDSKSDRFGTPVVTDAQVSLGDIYILPDAP